MSDRDQKMFSCAAHQFTIVANYDEASTRGSIGQRKAGCPDCTLAVNDALEYHKNCAPVEQPVLTNVQKAIDYLTGDHDLEEVATAYSEGYLRGQEVLHAEIARARPPSLEWDGIWAKSPTHNFFWEVNFGTLAVNYDYEWAQTVNIAECADEAAAKTLAAELQAVLDRYSEKTPPYNAYEGLTEMEDLPGGGFRIFRSAPKESE